MSAYGEWKIVFECMTQEGCEQYLGDRPKLNGIIERTLWGMYRVVDMG